MKKIMNKEVYTTYMGGVVASTDLYVRKAKKGEFSPYCVVVLVKFPYADDAEVTEVYGPLASLKKFAETVKSTYAKNFHEGTVLGPYDRTV